MRLAAAVLTCLAIACSGPAGPAPAAPAGAPAAASAPAPAPAPAPRPAAAPAVAPMSQPAPATPSPAAGTELATFASGCFWCTEAVLERLDGVLDVQSGYTGGQVEAPSYEQICGGDTGHAEAVLVAFDPRRIRYEQLLEWFFRSHDPTTLNRQGPDVGTQYRSAIFYHSEAQRQAALAAIEAFQPRFADPIVTEVAPAAKFWPAEAYHQDYFRNNPSKGYCRVMIAPKLDKLGLPLGWPKK